MKNHGAIAQYWSNKVITENGNLIDVEYGKAIPAKSLPIIDDLGEPCCMACSKPVGNDENESENLLSKWNEKSVVSALNKCHILAVQFGGGDEENNIFLMCECCHKESPDTKNRQAFFRWIYRRKKEFTYGVDLFGKVNLVAQELAERGYTDFALSVIEKIKPDEIYPKFKDNIGIHGGSASKSSIIIGVADCYEQALFEKIKCGTHP